VTALYAVVLIAGLLSLVAWVAATTVASSVAGWERVDPERRFGRAGRFVVAGLTGAGMAGMSAQFAGWASWPALLAAAAGGFGLAALSGIVGVAD
jgi:hypothetical protein